MNPLKKIYYRSFQGCVALGNRVLPWTTPELLTGAGAVKRLPALMREKGVGKVLIVAGKTALQRGALSGLLDAMENAGLPYVIYNGVEPNPQVEQVEEAYGVYRANHCDGILAFGGGSPMDCAKACGARVANPNRSVLQMKGLFKVPKGVPPVYAVPTTAGSGSETTMTAVITDGARNHKITINSLRLIPRWAVLDPELTVDMTPSMTATTGLDALCHAVESYTNRFYNTAQTRENARRAVKLIDENLYAAYCDGSDMEAREKMLLASHYAGLAFTRTGVGYAHSTGHTLGGLYHMAHGLAMGILLPHVMRAYGPAVFGRLAELAEVIGITEGTERERAEAFILWNEELKKKLSIPSGTHIIDQADIPQIVAWSLAEANPLYPVPTVWGEKELRALLDRVREK